MIITPLLVLCTLSASDGYCESLPITDCVVSGECDWNPAAQACWPTCDTLYEQAGCTANPTCIWTHGYCANNYTLPCEDRSIDPCLSAPNCGLLLGQNICKDCSSAQSRHQCSMLGCYWDGTTCGVEPSMCNYPDMTSCLSADCIWSGRYCTEPDVTNLCTTSNTTNCLRWKYNLDPCTSLSTPRKCSLQANCLWSSYSQSCEAADMCLRMYQNCTDVGCTEVANGLCSSAPEFSKCSSISTAECNSHRTCAVIGGTCIAIAGCNQLSQSTCSLKTDICEWNTAVSSCQAKGNVCKSLKFHCDGKPCENMITDPDMTSYEVKGEYRDGQVWISMSYTGVRYVPEKDGTPCVDCPGCAPGFLANIAATVSCGSDGGTATFDQQICLPPSSTFPRHSSSSSSAAIAAIVVGSIVAVSVVAIAVFMFIEWRKPHNPYSPSVQELE